MQKHVPQVRYDEYEVDLQVTVGYKVKLMALDAGSAMERAKQTMERDLNRRMEILDVQITGLEGPS